MLAVRIFWVALALLVPGCATGPSRAPETFGERPTAGSVLGSLKLDAALEDRILALDPGHITAAEVRDTLAKASAPRMVLIHGGIYPVYLAMSSFAEFLVEMGYPQAAIRRPDNVLDSIYSYSPYQESRDAAGVNARHYKREGLLPSTVA